MLMHLSYLGIQFPDGIPQVSVEEQKAMTTQIKTLIHKSRVSILRLALLSCLIAAAALLAADGTPNASGQVHTGHEGAAPAKLVELVRNATQQFTDVNARTGARHQPFL